MTYQISVRSLKGDVIHFHRVQSYEVIDGFVVFIDSYTGKTKRFAVANVEIEEEVQR